MGAMRCIGRTFTRAHDFRCGGFSLAELLVVVAIVALVLALAVPSMAAIVSAQQLSAFASALQVSLQLARNDAVMRGGTTVLCKSPDGSACSQTGGWEQGWIVFEDRNHNAQREQTEALIARQDAAPAGLTMRGNTPVSCYVSYNAVGSTRLTSGALQAGTFTVCAAAPAPGVAARRVVLAATGRARVAQAEAADCP